MCALSYVQFGRVSDREGCKRSLPPAGLRSAPSSAVDHPEAARSWGWGIRPCTCGWEDAPGFPKLSFLFPESAKGWRRPPWVGNRAARCWFAERERCHKGVFVWKIQSLGLWATEGWVLVRVNCQGEKCLRHVLNEAAAFSFCLRISSTYMYPFRWLGERWKTQRETWASPFPP